MTDAANDRRVCYRGPTARAPLCDRRLWAWDGVPYTSDPEQVTCAGCIEMMADIVDERLSADYQLYMRDEFK